MSTDSERRVCVLAREEKPHHTTTGLGCARCEDALAERLRALPDLYAMTGDFMEPGSAAPADGSKRTKADSAPLPVRIGAVSLRQFGGMAGPLFFWEDSVREWFELTAATFRGNAEQTVTGSVEFLLVWMPRIFQEFGPLPEFTKVIRNIHNEARWIIGDIEDKPNTVGNCPALMEAGDVCGSALFVDSYSAGEVHCVGGERHTWPREQWLLLGSQLPDIRNREASA